MLRWTMRLGERADLKPLTSLRFVAALMVFMYHAPLVQPWSGDHALGQAGVGFFFLLSGFILTYTYAPHVIRGRFDARAFYVARIARIYPAYLVSSMLALAVLAMFGGLAWNESPPWTRFEAVVAQVLAIQAWLPDERFYFGANSPAWSISVEAFFYLLFPMLIRSLARSFSTVSGPTIFIAALATWGCAIAAFSVPHYADPWSTYVFPPVRLVDFLVGMLLGLAFLRGYRLPGSATAWKATAIAAVAAGIVAAQHAPNALRYGLFLMPSWAAVIAVVALRCGVISRALSHPILVRLGEISFAFYLLHFSVLTVTAHLVPSPAVGVVALAATTTLAWGMYAFLERPLRAHIRAIARGHALPIAA